MRLGSPRLLLKAKSLCRPQNCPYLSVETAAEVCPMDSMFKHEIETCSLTTFCGLLKWHSFFWGEGRVQQGDKRTKTHVL